MGVARQRVLQTGRKAGAPEITCLGPGPSLCWQPRYRTPPVEVAGRHDEQGKTLGPCMWYGYVVLNWDLSSATPSPRLNGRVFYGRRQRLDRSEG